MDIIVLDTSTILSNVHSLYGKSNQHIVIPFGVLQELNRIKHEGNTPRGKSARDAVRALWEAISKEGKAVGIKLDTGAELSIATPESLAINETLEVDDQIIETAARMSGKIISNDIALLVKAGARGIEVADESAIKERIARQDLGELLGYQEVFVGEHLIDAIYDNGYAVWNEKLPENHYMVLRGETNPQKSLLVRYKKGRVHRFAADAMTAWGVTPKNVEQKFFMDLLLDQDVKAVFGIGNAGTGKTFVALAAALELFMERKLGYEKIIITKPVVALKGQEVGFLPGEVEDKIGPIYANLVGHLKNLLNKRGSLETMIEKERIVLQPLAFVRGHDIQKAIIIVDESQNLTSDDMKTLLTRVGEGSKIIFLGDPSQIDAPKLSKNNCGIIVGAERMIDSPMVGIITLKGCLRSGLAELAIERF